MESQLTMKDVRQKLFEMAELTYDKQGDTSAALHNFMRLSNSAMCLWFRRTVPMENSEPISVRIWTQIKNQKQMQH